MCTIASNRMVSIVNSNSRTIYMYCTDLTTVLSIAMNSLMQELIIFTTVYYVRIL